MSQLAQANVARLRAPLDDPLMREFVAALDRVNRRPRQAEASYGDSPQDTATASA